MRASLFYLMLAAACAGCAGETFPLPSPASLQPAPKALFTEEQQAGYIQIARAYVLQQGKDPTPVLYDVQSPHPDDEDAESGQAASEAVVVASFQDGNVWRLALKSDGTISRLTRH